MSNQVTISQSNSTLVVVRTPNGGSTYNVADGLPYFNPNQLPDLSGIYVPQVKTGDLSAFGWFFPEAHGAVGDGTHDDTAAVLAAITAAMSGGGQVGLTPGKTYRCTGALVFPTTGPSGAPVQKPVRITSSVGSGAWNGYWAASPLNAGAVLDLRYDGTDGLHPTKIDTRGAGMLEIDHVTLMSGGTDNFPFMQTTNTTVHLHHLTVIGNQANTGTACTQDFLFLGGTDTTVGSGANAPFQGYGSHIHDIEFHHIRRHVTWRTFANSVFVDHCTTSITCGSSETHGAPYVFAPHTGGPDVVVGNGISDCTVEVTNYPHAVAFMNNAIQNTVRNVAAWDAGTTTQSAVYVAPGAGAAYNHVVGGYIVGTKPYVIDSDGTTTNLACSQSTPSLFPQGVSVRGSGTLGLGAAGASADDWKFQRANGSYLSLVPTTYSGSFFKSGAERLIIGDDGGANYWTIGAVGTEQWIQPNGTSANINVRIFAKGSGIVVVGNPLVVSTWIRIGTTTTAGRPGAGTPAAGGQMYDTTLGAPIFSDGTNWSDANGVVTPLATKTASYSMVKGDGVIVANGSSITISLPDPTTVNPGRVYRVKNINASAATVNSQGTSKTIDGATSASLAQWAAGRYVSDGTQWLAV